MQGLTESMSVKKDYGLRLPQTLSYDEINRIAQLVHAAGKELTVAVNALMHQSMMDSIKPFLDFLKEIQADYITVGDAGVFYVLKRDGYPFKTIYDASTMVTSSRQINFWGKQAGASEAVLAREIPSAELFVMAENLQIPAEVLVYGASIIHHSKRPLLQNYYNFHQDRGLCNQRSGSVLGRARRSKFSLFSLRGQTWNPYLLK